MKPNGISAGLPVRCSSWTQPASNPQAPADAIRRTSMTVVRRSRITIIAGSIPTRESIYCQPNPILGGPNEEKPDRPTGNGGVVGGWEDGRVGNRGVRKGKSG